ncbi:MAG: GGDEF domain-containing protein [Clostridia bacterium]|nr:GGDEF domain-containing protein [Clostridia bacterium]
MKKNFHMIIILLVLTIIVFITYNVNILQNEIKENQYNALINDLRRDTTNFGLWISQKKSIVNTAKDICNNFSFDELRQWHTDNPYLNINNDDPSISQIYIGLADGDFITGGQWIPPDDYDPRTRTWYIEAYEAGETVVSKVYVDRETGEKLVTISSPFYLDDEFVGIISANVFLKTISTYLTTQITERNSYSYLVDEDGTIVIHTNRPYLEGQNIYTDINNAELNNYFDQVKETKDIIRMEYFYEEENIIGIVQKVDGRNWYLAVARIDDASLFDIQVGGKWTLLINGLSLFIILILIYMILKARSELNNMNELLTTENEKDFLTGIFNRRYLNLYLESIWNKEEHVIVSILLMDVDYFKNYNDTYGHILGDEVLTRLTDAINETIRKDDVFARFGGEEFALVLENVDQEEALKIAYKIRDAVYELNMEHNTSPFGRVTISIGSVTLMLDHHINVRDAVDCADKALYEAKASGRNKVSIYTD